MNRRTLLNRAAAVTAVGALAGCLDANSSPGANDGANGDDGNGDDETDTEDTETEQSGADGDGTADGDGGNDETNGDGGDGDESGDDSEEMAGEEDDTTEPEGEDGSETDDEPEPDETPADDGSESSGSSGHGEAGAFPAGEYRLRSTEGICGEDNDATLTLEDGVATVEGWIATPDPCHRATVEEHEFTDSKVFEATIGAESTAEMCQQCTGTVEYDAEFVFDDRIPTTVIVKHAARSGTDEVARVDAED